MANFSSPVGRLLWPRELSHRLMEFKRGRYLVAKKFLKSPIIERDLHVSPPIERRNQNRLNPIQASRAEQRQCRSPVLTSTFNGFNLWPMASEREFSNLIFQTGINLHNFKIDAKRLALASQTHCTDYHLFERRAT